MKIVNVEGGLGSQMMAYSLYLALEKAYPNEKVICDFTAYHKYYRVDHNGSELNRVFGVKEDCLPIPLAPIIHSGSLFPRVVRKFLTMSGAIKYHDAIQEKYNYDKNVFYLNGTYIYWQCWTSWKYFLGVEEKVLETFKFRPIKGRRNIETQKRILLENSVSIHVRRGDYIGNTVIGELIDIDYYIKALEIIFQNVSNPHFFIFSDDPEWVTNILAKEIQAPTTHINWNKGLDSYLDMQLMASCRHHIIPNSSFSWWGAYLAKSEGQLVIAPKYWSNYSSGIELKDMNLPDWVVIENRTAQ